MIEGRTRKIHNTNHWIGFKGFPPLHLSLKPLLLERCFLLHAIFTKPEGELFE
jgi:hypothetical protein